MNLDTMYRNRIYRALISMAGPILLAACALNISQAPAEVGSGPGLKLDDLQDRGPAPELRNATWLNINTPMRLFGLKGKVVLLDFGPLVGSIARE